MKYEELQGLSAYEKEIEADGICAKGHSIAARTARVYREAERRTGNESVRKNSRSHERYPVSI